MMLPDYSDLFMMIPSSESHEFNVKPNNTLTAEIIVIPIHRLEQKISMLFLLNLVYSEKCYFYLSHIR